MLHISLPDGIESRLATEAERRGVHVNEYASELLTRHLSKPSVDEVLAPFRQQVSESGLTDDAFDRLFQSAREDVWRQQHGDPS